MGALSGGALHCTGLLVAYWQEESLSVLLQLPQRRISGQLDDQAN